MSEQSKRFSVKVHHSYREVVAVCDLELLGKKFEEGNRQLYVRENFFKEEELEEENLIKLLKKYRGNDATFNIVGKESITAALKAEIISKENVGSVEGIPFALILL